MEFTEVSHFPLNIWNIGDHPNLIYDKKVQNFLPKMSGSEGWSETDTCTPIEFRMRYDSYL